MTPQHMSKLAERESSPRKRFSLGNGWELLLLIVALGDFFAAAVQNAPVVAFEAFGEQSAQFIRIHLEPFHSQRCGPLLQRRRERLLIQVDSNADDRPLDLFLKGRKLGQNATFSA